ncbi:inositol monophosphatase [Agaricicola taiwanensis]|uniref:Inositol-1-monophosphatase n=1 Tax=Agaricicola taiwanensis TaxID=591372 RepID=A0A8J2YD45_9RHOB|nr:inositol monophosphatase family protein [Agaricicola taiwanensis]GGE38934.1 inositol monophosphatase [Agaricicola taiwanensis]
MPRSALMTVMARAVLAAGKGMRRDFNEVEQLQVSIKGPADFVSAADRRAEETIRRELEKARPGYGFLMEEAGEIPGTDAEHRWIVDPLDGTTNFLHGMPHFAISVALERAGNIVAGIIYNPATDELYTAERGQGAYFNDRRIRVAARQKLRESVIACGIPFMGHGEHDTFRAELAKVQAQVAGVRRFGSAALDLAWVASGRFDGYWERHLQAWDIAAGLLLVKEAGGYVSDAWGGQKMLETGTVVAGNETIQRDLLRLVGKV